MAEATSKNVAVNAERPYFLRKTIKKPNPTSSIAMICIARSYFWTSTKDDIVSCARQAVAVVKNNPRTAIMTNNQRNFRINTITPDT
jgi:hypothetical protein